MNKILYHLQIKMTVLVTKPKIYSLNLLFLIERDSCEIKPTLRSIMMWKQDSKQTDSYVCYFNRCLKNNICVSRQCYDIRLSEKGNGKGVPLSTQGVSKARLHQQLGCNNQIHTLHHTVLVTIIRSSTQV